MVHEQDEAMKVGFRLIFGPARSFEKVVVKFAVSTEVRSLHERTLAGDFTATRVVRRIVCVCRSIYCVRRGCELFLLLLEELEELLVAGRLFGCCGDRDPHQHESHNGPGDRGRSPRSTLPTQLFTCPHLFAPHLSC